MSARQIVNCCEMSERIEQRYCIKFCQKLRDTQAETIRKIQQAFGDDAMRIAWIKEWYNRFKDGRSSVDNEPRSGTLSSSRNDNFIDQWRTLVLSMETSIILEAKKSTAGPQQCKDHADHFL